jgi:hypothetical protein
MIRSLITAALLLGGATAFAGTQQQQQQLPSNTPNVLVIRVQLDQTGVQSQQGAKAVGLTVDLKRDTQGNVDWSSIAKDTQSQVDQAQGMDLKASTDMANVPSQVQQAFQQAGQRGGTHDLSWSWYYPYNSGGWYGYGYYPYYGYYNYYYPYYGYYYNNYLYNYYYGYFYPYGNYGYYYYYY